MVMSVRDDARLCTTRAHKQQLATHQARGAVKVAARLGKIEHRYVPLLNGLRRSEHVIISGWWGWRCVNGFNGFNGFNGSNGFEVLKGLMMLMLMVLVVVFFWVLMMLMVLVVVVVFFWVLVVLVVPQRTVGRPRDSC